MGDLGTRLVFRFLVSADSNVTRIIFSPLENRRSTVTSLHSGQIYHPPDICGKEWQSQYQELHADIVSGREKPKFLVYSCPWKNSAGCCGYGNRVRALVSMFYLAVLTDRAFLIDWREPRPLQQFLIPKSIDWNFPIPDLTNRKHYWRTGGEQSNLRRGWLTKNTSTFVSWLQTEDMTRYFDHPVEIASSCLFFAPKAIMENEYLMKRAHVLKIRPLLPGVPRYSMIGCAYDYLFRPRKSVQDRLETTRKALRGNGNFVIGLHIRLGDKLFGRRNDTRVSNFQKFFSCAAKVEREIFHLSDDASRRQCRWFLATDSLLVKKYALKYFPEKVVTSENKPEHLDIYKKGEKTSDEGMIGILHDHYILAESDFFVLSDSSFGLTAVGLSMRKDDSYTLGETCDLKLK